MEIKVERMANNGKGVGTAPDGKTVFVPGTVPGDRLLAEVTAEKGRLYDARILSILSPSADRIGSDCPELERCGGCCFRQMRYERELDEKSGFVREAFRRIGGFDVECEPVIPSPLTEAYRNKAEFAVRTDADGKLSPGFYSEKTHQVMPVDNCLLIPEEFIKITKEILNIININKIIETDNNKNAAENTEIQYNKRHYKSQTLKYFKKEKISKFIEKSNRNRQIIDQIILRKSGLTGEIMLCIVTTDDIAEKLTDAAEQIRAEFPTVSSVCMLVSRSAGTLELDSSPRFLSGAPFIRDQICGVPVEIGPLSFFQVNTPAAEKLYRTAAEYADVSPEDVVLDLYCGMGTIGLAVASGCRQLIGGEIVPEAVSSARHNAAAMGLANTRFLCGDAGKIAGTLISEKIHPDLIVLDPPRRGCSPETLQAVLTLDPDRIVMVSCDPATAARDCRILCDHGYILTRLRPVDLFPRTKHVETCILLSKRKPTSFIEADPGMDELDLTAAESKASYQEIKDFTRAK